MAIDPGTQYYSTAYSSSFPKLRVAYLEAGCAWVPFMMDRMDEEMEKPYRVSGAAAETEAQRAHSQRARFGPLVKLKKKRCPRYSSNFNPEMPDVAVGLSA